MRTRVLWYSTGSFRLHQFCYDQQLMQCIAINWEFSFLLQCTAFVAGHSRIFFAIRFLFSKEFYNLHFINAVYNPHHPNVMVKIHINLIKQWGAFVQWLWEETHITKVVGSNPGTVYLLDIFHIYLLLKTYFFKKREYSDHWTTTAS